MKDLHHSSHSCSVFVSQTSILAIDQFMHYKNRITQHDNTIDSDKELEYLNGLRSIGSWLIRVKSFMAVFLNLCETAAR